MFSACVSMSSSYKDVQSVEAALLLKVVIITNLKQKQKSA